MLVLLKKKKQNKQEKKLHIRFSHARGYRFVQLSQVNAQNDFVSTMDLKAAQHRRKNVTRILISYTRLLMFHSNILSKLKTFHYIIRHI